MRLVFCVPLLGLLGVAASAVIEPVPQVQRQLKSVVAPKLERRVENPHDDHTGKRDFGDTTETWFFGSFNTDKGDCSGGCLLKEPKVDGRPYPYCNNFPGAVSWNLPDTPKIKDATVSEVVLSQDGVRADSKYPQWICFFYNDFDCDPEKGGGPGPVQWTSLTDKDWKNGNPKDRTFEFSVRTNDDKKELWYHIKAYGCMLYVDAPEKPSGSGGQAEGGSHTEGMMSHDLAEQLAAGQAIADGSTGRTRDATLRRP